MPTLQEDRAAPPVAILSFLLAPSLDRGKLNPCSNSKEWTDLDCDEKQNSGTKCFQLMVPTLVL